MNTGTRQLKENTIISMNAAEGTTIAIVRLPYEAKSDGESRARYARVLNDMGIAYHHAGLVDGSSLADLKTGDVAIFRWAANEFHARIMQLVVPALERRGVVCIPRWNELWYFNDKVAVAQSLSDAGVRTPRTKVFYTLEGLVADAKHWSFPVVLKDSIGAGGSGVFLVHSEEALIAQAARRFFSRGVLFDARGMWTRKGLLRVGKQFAKNGPLRFLRKVAPRLLGDLPWSPSGLVAPLVLQEYVPGQEGDVRVTIIGHRAFYFRRANRPKDFRASGSGNIDFSQEGAGPFVAAGFACARALGVHTVAIDFLVMNGEPVAIEISPEFVCEAVQATPGFWNRKGEFIEGRLWPEYCELQDALAKPGDVALGA